MDDVEQKLVDFFKRKLAKIDELEKVSFDSDEARTWIASVGTALKDKFGGEAQQYRGFNHISYSEMVVRRQGYDYSAADQKAYLDGLKKARAHLLYVIENIEEWGYSGPVAENVTTKGRSRTPATHITNNNYISQETSVRLEQAINLEQYAPDIREKVDELLSELQKPRKDTGKIQSLLLWLTDKSVDVMIALLVAKYGPH